jgi:hypothetical protein
LLRILGVFRVHNGADVLPRVLDALSGWCDDIYAIDDRSTDDSAEILHQHPAVTNLVRARSDLPRTRHRGIYRREIRHPGGQRARATGRSDPIPRIHCAGASIGFSPKLGIWTGIDRYIEWAKEQPLQLAG